MLKVNVISNYFSQIYVTLINILIIPFYIKYLGSESYGLIGFFAMLQAWFALLDLGLTPTIARETARYNGGTISALEFRQLLRALTVIFSLIAFIGGGTLWLLSDTISRSWLNIDTLPLEVVNFSVEIIGVVVALRWLCGLFRGVITGSEKLVWLSVFNIVIASLRFLGVFITMSLFGYTAPVFFLHQLFVAILELFLLWLMSQFLIPSREVIEKNIGWSIKPVKLILRFSLSIAFTSSVWILVTQIDKMVLSGFMPLSEYGYFTLAVLVASGIMMVSGPISSAIMPRMARLYAEGKENEMLLIYRSATQVVTIIAGSAAIVIAFCAESLLLLWTGDAFLAEKVAPILKLYAIGNGFLAVSAFPYYLQYALGCLRYHLMGNVVMALVLVPSIVLAAKYYGGVGAGIVWVSVNLFYFVFWCSYVHSKIKSDIVFSWLFKDVIRIVLPSAMISLIIIKLCIYNNVSILNELVLISCVSLFISCLFSSLVKKMTHSKLREKNI